MTVTAPPRPPRPGVPVDRDELEALVNALIEEARQRARRRRIVLAALAISVASAGLAVFVVFDRTAQSRSPSAPHGARAGAAAQAASSKLAFVSTARAGGSPTIYIVNADGHGRRRVTTYDGWGADVAWSPDAQRLAFTRGDPWTSDIYVVRTDGSHKRRLTHSGANDGLPAWSPDGRSIAFVRWRGGGDLYVMNSDGSSVRRLIQNAGGVGAPPSWSPDGRKLVFVGYGPGGSNIYVINADGSGQRTLMHLAAYEGGLSWSPDGRRIALVKGKQCLSCSPKDVAGMGPRTNSELWVMRADGSGKHLVALGKHMGVPSWSPDGAMLVYGSAYRPRPNTPKLRFLKVPELFLVKADGSGKRRLTHGGLPLWSPDGKKIAFVRWPGGRAELYLINPDGSDPQRLTRTPTYGERAFAWSAAPKPK